MATVCERCWQRHLSSVRVWPVEIVYETLLAILPNVGERERVRGESGRASYVITDASGNIDAELLLNYDYPSYLCN